MTTGRKPTKRCNHCDVKLKERDNWSMGNVRKQNYICKKCDNAKRRKNRLKQKGK